MNINSIPKISLLTVLTSSLLVASGWRVPEQSPRSVALSGAYVANAHGADASYYNPANMSFNEDKLQMELAAMYIGLTSINYDDNISSLRDSSSKKEHFFVPTMFLSSAECNGVRYGFSITAPGGLAKRWNDPFAKTFAEEFTLRIVDVNPSISYQVSDKFAIGAGLRAIYSDGVVKSDGMVAQGVTLKREMEGDTIEFGYNLALAYKPTKDVNLSVTYRSNVDIKEEGNAKLYFNGALAHDSGASVAVPLPAVLSLACAYDFGDTTVEFEFDRTYWSEYKDLDFEYDNAITNSSALVQGALISAFDDAKVKNWKDTNAFRIGITHQYNENLTLMAGFAIDKNPAPEANIGFELPDSDAKLYSVGCDYKLDNNSSIGFGYLYDVKESRTVNAGDINGTFSNAKAHLLSFGYRKSF